MEEREEELYFRAWLRRRRKALDLTQTEFGNRVGYAEVTIRKIETGSMPPSYEFAERLAQYLDIPTPEQKAFVEWACGKRSVARPGSLQTDITIKPWTLPLPASAPIPEASPYVGLLTFQETDAERFFGRDLLVADLVERLHTTAFLAVLGPSGSGKSSVVRAGLIPKLKGGALEGSESWRYLTLRPGARPLDMLATELVKLQGGELDRVPGLRRELAEDVRALLLAVETLLDRAQDQQFVLVVDQAEELWTLADPAQRDGFIASLLAAVDAVDTPLHIVLTMRADFLHRAIEHRPLAEWIERAVAFVSPLTCDELRAAIERPAEPLGGRFEAGLVDELIEQALDRPGALPLLEYTLLELWKRRAPDGTVQWVDYQAIGGVEGALAARADAILAEHYTAEQQAELRAIVLRLVQPGEGAADTRRRMRLVDLASEGQYPQAVQALLKPLIDERLLTTGSDDVGLADTVELSHEALIRAWPTFSAWVTEARADLVQQVRLEEAAREWQRNDENEDFLWAGLPLANAEAWLARARPRLTAHERLFLERSRAREQARVAAERRSTLRLRASLVVVSLLLLISIGVTIYARGQARRADAQADAGEALFELGRDNGDRGLLLAQAAAVNDTLPYQPLVVRAARQAVQETVPNIVLQGHTDPIEAVAWSPDGKLVLTGSWDGTARVWESASGKVVVMLEGHTDAVNAVAWSPDGKLVLTGSEDGTARVWESASGKVVATLEGHTEVVSAVAWQSNGEQVLIGSEDGTARVWEATSGKVVATLEGHTEAVSAVAWRSNGEQVLTGSEDGTARVWEATSGKLLATLGYTGAIWAVAWSPDGKQVLTGSEDGTARVWEATSGKVLTTLEGHTGAVDAVAWSPDGKQVLTGSRDWTVQVWEATSGNPIATLGYTGAIWAVAWSPDGKQIVTGSTDGTAGVWEATSGRLLAALEGHTDAIWAVAWSPDGKQVLTGSLDNTARVWEATSGKVLAPLEEYAEAIRAVAWSPDGKMALTGNWDGTARVWEATGGKVLATLEGHTDAVNAVAWSPDGKLVLTGSYDGTARVWEAMSGSLLTTLERHTEGVNVVGWSPDGKMVLTGNSDGTARVWETMSGRLLATLDGHTEGVLVAAWSPDGKLVLTGSYDGPARVWEAMSGRVVATLEHTGQVWAVAWSRDGKMVLMGSNDGTVRVWEAMSGRVVATLEGHTDGVRAMAWSPDGKQVLTGSEDGTARVWEATGGRVVATLEGHTEAVRAVAWSPDGKQVLTGSWDRMARVWEATSGKPIATLEGHTDGVIAAGWSPDGKQIITGSWDGTARVWIVDNRVVMAELTRRVCHIFTDEAIRREITNWPGCASALVAVEADLKVYDALRRER